MPASQPASPSLPPLNRKLVIATSVVLFHVAALWALQSGLLRRAVEVFVPVAILGDIVNPPAPQVEPPAPVPTPPEPVQEPVVKKQERTPPPAATPAATSNPSPATDAPTATFGPQQPSPFAIGPIVAEPQAVAAPPSTASTQVELPSSDADYLQNPKPAYPPISKRLGEQGKVVVRVLIGQDGAAQKAEIRQSSGFDRLDQAALATVLKWRYLPGKRGGVAEAMWFNIPINFVLE